jgi:hypothetical protein
LNGVPLEAFRSNKGTPKAASAASWISVISPWHQQITIDREA